MKNVTKKNIFISFFLRSVKLFSVAVLLSSCSIQQMAYNSIADMLAPSPKAVEKAKLRGETDPMIALTGETDTELVKAFFPTALKLYEILHLQNPKHPNLALTTGQLYITYANAFIQQPAEQLPMEQFDLQNSEYLRSITFYSRGSNYARKALDIKIPSFSLLMSTDTGKQKALSLCTKDDVGALYWTSAGILGAFSLSPLDTNLLSQLDGAILMLERAAILDPSYMNGAIQEILFAFYAAAPESLGGSMEKAEKAYDLALEYSKNSSPTLHIAYAKILCIPQQDSLGFDTAIQKALDITVADYPDNALLITLAHKQANYLLENKANFILE